MQPLNPRFKVSVLAGGLAVVVGLGASFGPPERTNTFGAVPAGAAAPEAAPASTALDFPGVPGVDLVALGYQGADLDELTVADVDGPLPALPMERASVLRERIATATPHLHGLRAADRLLRQTERSMAEEVEAVAAEVAERAEVATKRTARVERLRAAVAQQDALQSSQPALDVGDGISDATVIKAGLDAQAAAEAQAAAQDQLDALQADRQSHQVAVNEANRSRGAMHDHVASLHTELRRARAGMLDAGVALADQERAREELSIVEVEGFEVNAAVASSLRDLLAAAEADGMDLRHGSSYRPVEDQIELRKQNCGTSEYEIYEAPSGSCSPPTAKPGRSLHETGLAIDFRHGEEGISTRSSPAYQWLAANAPGFGFFNLPSEPWHWSVSGA